MLKKKIWANFQRIIELYTKKIVKKLFKIWSWDPGSEIRNPEKTHSGSRIRIRNTASYNAKLLTGFTGVHYCRSVSAGEVGDLWAVLDCYEGVGGVVVRRRGINPASPGGDEWEPCVGGGWKQITVRGRIK